MNTKKCLNAEKLIGYIDVKLKQNERRAITIHLAQCNICTKNLRILQGIDKLLLIDKEKSQKMDRNRMKEECITNEMFYEYLEGRVSEEEAITIEYHLNSCPICFQEFASLLRNTLSPITDFEKSEISKLRNIPAEEQVAKIISIVEENRIPAVELSTEEISLISKFWEKIRLFISKSPVFNTQWRYASAFACLVLLVLFVGYPRYKIWRSNSLTNKGISYFTSEYMITEEDEPRPIGGFNFSIFSHTRDQQRLKTIDSAKIALENALQLNNKNLLAHQYLGTYFLIIEGDLETANYYYQFVYSQDSTNAAILNDLGVLAIHQKNYDDAEARFLKALEYDPNLLEAQFNLAFTYFKQRKGEKAEQEWNKYIMLDPKRSWADIARKFIDQLKK